LGLAGCGSSAPPPPDAQQFAAQAALKQQEMQAQAAKDVVEQTPPWYAAPPTDTANMYAVGTAVSSDMQFALDKASLNAKRALADQVRGKLSADMKDYLEESGGAIQPASAVRGERVVHDVVTDVDLNGYEVAQRKVIAAGTGFRAFILIRYPISAAAHQVVAAVHQDDTDGMKLRATKAFTDLEREINDAQGPHALAPVAAQQPQDAQPAQPPMPIAAPRPAVDGDQEN
jgi:hypothetical protein